MKKRYSVSLNNRADEVLTEIATELKMSKSHVVHYGILLLYAIRLDKVLKKI